MMRLYMSAGASQLWRDTIPVVAFSLGFDSDLDYTCAQLKRFLYSVCRVRLCRVISRPIEIRCANDYSWKVT